MIRHQTVPDHAKFVARTLASRRAPRTAHRVHLIPAFVTQVRNPKAAAIALAERRDSARSTVSHVNLGTIKVD